MITTQTYNAKTITFAIAATGMLVVLGAPGFAGAQNVPEQAGAAMDRGGPATERGGAPDLSAMRAQVEALRAQVETLRAQADTARGAGDRGAAENRPVMDGGLPDLPEQASDRARQVMQCLQLGRTLRLGMTGDDVQQMQEFLREQGFFNFSTATGYYGPITQEAIEAFQSSEGIVSSGSPDTTGFGQVGPRTQAALAQASCLRQEQAVETPDVVEDENGSEEEVNQEEEMSEEEDDDANEEVGDDDAGDEGDEGDEVDEDEDEDETNDQV